MPQKQNNQAEANAGDTNSTEPVDLNFFKMAIYDKRDPDRCALIKENLKKSVKERSEIFKAGEVDIRRSFPCVLLNHELVKNARI